MELTVSTGPTYVLARASGPLDESGRELFRQQLHPLIGQRGTRLILDLSGSPRINSPGIGNLVALVADANTNGSRVILCNLQSFVMSVMSVTKLDKYFEIAVSLDEAITKATAPSKGGQ
jgi:anti-anti-sigma factor